VLTLLITLYASLHLSANRARVMPNEAHHEAAKPAADVLAQADVVPGPVDQDAAANAGLIICVSKAIKALEDDRLHHEDDKECVKALDAILTLLDGVQGGQP
jgi:hypothetical protein